MATNNMQQKIELQPQIQPQEILMESTESESSDLRKDRPKATIRIYMNEFPNEDRLTINTKDDINQNHTFNNDPFSQAIDYIIAGIIFGLQDDKTQVGVTEETLFVLKNLLKHRIFKFGMKLISIMDNTMPGPNIFEDVIEDFLKAEHINIPVLNAFLDLNRINSGQRYQDNFNKIDAISCSGDLQIPIDENLLMLPPMPLPRTYIGKKVHVEPVTEYEPLRERAAQQKKDFLNALNGFWLRTNENRELDNSLIPCKPSHPAYLKGLNPIDQIFDFDELEFDFALRNRTGSIMDFTRNLEEDKQLAKENEELNGQYNLYLRPPNLATTEST